MKISDLHKNQSERELVSTIRYRIPIETDITGIHLSHGAFDFLVGGPGLTADILKLKKTAKDGKVYVLYTKDIPKVLEWFNQTSIYTNVGDYYLPTLYEVNTGEYQIAIIDPVDYGLEEIHKEELILFNNDCLVSYLEANLMKGIPHNGIFLYKQKQFGETIKFANLDPRLVKFSQIYIKAYQRLGIKIDYATYQYVWRTICASSFRADLVNDIIKMQEWIDNLDTEDLTYIR